MNALAIDRRVTTCGCSRRYSPSEFAQLAQRGIQEVEGAADLQLANCTCGSTIAMPVERTIEVRRLCAADLLMGVANIHPYVIGQEWVGEAGEPDSLLVFMSNARIFSLRFEAQRGSAHPACFEHGKEVAYDDTGLSLSELVAFERELRERYTGQQQEAAS